MADPPFISDEPQQGAPLNAVASAFKWARDQILPNPNAGVSLANMARGGLESMGRWAQGVTDPSAITPSAVAAPAGAAALTSPFVAAARGMDPSTLHGFIGPAQAARLDRTPGSRGSLGALEQAQATWAKGGTDPGALAETWAKHGWAPPEAFGTRGAPFTWQQLPDLRIRDDIMDQHQAALAQGKDLDTRGALPRMMQPNADLRRLLQGTPQLGQADAIFQTGPRMPFNGAAGPSAKTPGVNELTDFDNLPPANLFHGQGGDPIAAESILIGHELRGHGMPGWGGAQQRTISENAGDFRRPIYGTSADRKIMAEADKMGGELAGMTTPFERRIMSRAIEGMSGTRDRAADQAAYFAQPWEKMARHAAILDQLERGGQSPFKEGHAPGVMSTYGPRALHGVEKELLGSDGLYTMRDLAPPANVRLRQSAEPFMAE